jgi:hypothetical protein
MGCSAAGDGATEVTVAWAWNRIAAVVAAPIVFACGPSGEALRFLADRTFEGPSLDLSKPGTAEWVCSYQGRTFEPFDAELVFRTDNTTVAMEQVIRGTFLLRASVSCFIRDAAGRETLMPGLDGLRPFDAPRALSTDGVSTTLARFKAGGTQPLVIRFTVTVPDTVLADLHPRLLLRPEYLDK